VNDPLDLGHEHTLRFTRWAPDPQRNPQHAGLAAVERVGAIVAHASDHECSASGLSPAGWCEGSILFDSQVTRRLFPHRSRWTVESWEPLTLSPSLLCHCGDHGHIIDGRWRPA
jgi:hypothetical protein